MGRKNDPNWRCGNTFTEEELNPDRPHNYRKTHNGESPIGNIGKIMKEMKETDPEGYAKMREENNKKISEKKSMRRRIKEILESTISLSEEERGGMLEEFKKTSKITVEDAILYAQITKAIKDKDTVAAAFVRDTSGQKPKDEVEHNVSIDNLLKNNGILEEEED